VTFALWCAVIGVLLVTVALAGTLVGRLPISTSMLYLAVGFGLGPVGLGVLDVDPFAHSEVIERIAEIALLISLFVTGLKLSVPLSDRRWAVPLRLAFVSMMLTVALIALTGMLALGLSLGAAVLLGGILAPTDPVLASDVQVEDPTDSDRLRFGLSGEAGLNDGTAFPFVMLGLGLLGLHDLGTGGWRWVVVDVLWAIGGGVVIGAVLGWLVGKLVIYLRVHHREAIGLDELLALGLIALAYGLAVLAHTYGFLAVIAAGLALRRIEPQPDDKAVLRGALHHASENTGPEMLKAEEAVATDPQHATAYMTQTVLGFNEQLERMGEVVVVLAIGAMLSYLLLSPAALLFVPALLFVIRPVCVWLGLLGSRSSNSQRGLIAWFGIRGVGSVYYLMYAINHGLSGPIAEDLVTITLVVVSASIVLHGISVTPLMRRYTRAKRRASSP
jgi:NhaP-type Na+/H+ or K+/H+ antiporter